MIVKVQQSITTTEENRQMLIYNKSRTIHYQADLTEEVEGLLGKRFKAYFKARLTPDKQIELIKEIKPQNW